MNKLDTAYYSVYNVIQEDTVMKIAPNTKTVQVRLYENDYAKILELAANDGLTVSEYVRRIIIPEPSRKFPVRKHGAA